jgi:hypothetical protein
MYLYHKFLGLTVIVIKRIVMKAIVLIITMCGMNFLLSCCNKLFPDEKLTLQRRDYIGKELRTDGYYYYFTQNNTVVYFLYKNGIILCAHSYSSHDLNTIESEMVKI